MRFGITVSRRQARRAVARNVVKRVLREAARRAAGTLEPALQARTVDVLLRLKAPLPPPSAAGWDDVKQQLRREADSLLEQLSVHLARPEGLAASGAQGSMPAAPQNPSQSLAQSAPAMAPGPMAPAAEG